MSRKIIAIPLPGRGRLPVAPQRRPAAPSPWVPHTDLFQPPTALVIHVELAGRRRDDLDLRVAGDQLYIRRVRREHHLPAAAQAMRREILYGTFESCVVLPSGYDPAHARADYQNGFLRVEVPRAKATAPRTDATITMRKSSSRHTAT